MSLVIPVVHAFNERGVAYVVVGGIAALLHGHVRITSDIDVVIRLDSTNLMRAFQTLGEIGYIPRSGINPSQLVDEDFRKQLVERTGTPILSLYKPADPLLLVDLFLEYPIPFDDLVRDAAVLPFGDAAVRVCSIEHLIEMKQKTGRAKDLEDVKHLSLIRRHA